MAQRSSNFHPAHESYLNRSEFNLRVNSWYISPTQLFTEKRLPSSIQMCLESAGYWTFPEFFDEWDIEGTLIHYNPHNLDGYFPEDMFNGEQVGDWNIPFVMRVLFLENWNHFIDLFGNSTIPHNDVGNCLVCMERCFDAKDMRSYTIPAENYDGNYKGFYMCKNSTKDNHHVLCTDCFTQLMVDRGRRFTRNPTCPGCNCEPNTWIACTYASTYDADELPLRWMKEFYSYVRNANLQDDVRLVSNALVDANNRLATNSDLLARQVEAHMELRAQLDHYMQKLKEVEKEVVEYREKWTGALDQLAIKNRELLHYRIKELELLGPTPSILGKRGNKGQSIRNTIKNKKKNLEEKFEELAEDVKKEEDDLEEEKNE